MTNGKLRMTRMKQTRKATRQPRVARERETTYKRAGLTSRESATIARFRAQLHQVLRGDQIKSLILYGSKSRGDARCGADVDLLLVYNDVTHEQKETVEDLATELFGRTRPQIHVLTYPADRVSQSAELGMPLFVNIAREGKTLEGEPLMVNETNKPKVSQSFLESAKGRLHAAQVLIDSGEYRDSISRSYYAVLDAADAALIAKGFTPRSHEGSIALFGAHFVKKGLVDKDFGALFKRMSKIRKSADYDRETAFTKDDAEYWFKLARDFVDTIENLLPTLLEGK